MRGLRVATELDENGVRAFDMNVFCCTTLFWLLLGMGFLVAGAGVTWVLIILSTDRGEGRSIRTNGSRS
jgi:hypothetical protein